MPDEKDKILLAQGRTITTDPKQTDTTHDKKTVVTEKDPVITNEQKQSWRYNADGTPNQPLIDWYDEQRRQLQHDYHIDPTTGEADKNSLFAAMGIRPDVMRKQREKEQKLNEWKKKEAALYNATAVLGDILSAGMGGNVWKRDKDQTAQQAHAANQALIREQAADDAANANAMAKAQEGYRKAIDALNKNMEAYNRIVRTQTGGKTTQTTTGGDTHTTVTGGTQHQTGYTEQQPKGAGKGSGAGGSKTTKIVNIRVKDKNGNTTTEPFEIPANQFDTMGRYLSEVYSNLTNEGKHNVDALLAQHNIFPRDTGTGKNTYDGADLLASGIVFDDPQIRSEFVRIVQNDSSRTDEEKQAILQAMIEYPTNATAEKKRSWWQRVKDWFKSDNNQDEDEGYNPDVATSTEGGL